VLLFSRFLSLQLPALSVSASISPLIDLKEEEVEPEGSLEDRIEVENSLLQDAQLGIVRCLLSSPVLSNEWRDTTIF